MKNESVSRISLSYKKNPSLDHGVVCYREKAEEISRVRAEIESKGGCLPPPKKPEEHFDSNCITPVRSVD